MTEQPPLKPLHDLPQLSSAKLLLLAKLSSEELKRSLALGQQHCLKARPDGTMLDGHHRVHVLRMRNEDVDALPREVLNPPDETF